MYNVIIIIEILIMNDFLISQLDKNQHVHMDVKIMTLFYKSALFYHSDEIYRNWINEYIIENKLILYINICYCQSITDISMFTIVNTLNIFNCKNIKDFGNLKLLRKLYLHNNANIYGIHLLKNLHELNNCKQMKRYIIKKLNKYKKINALSAINYFKY